MTPKISVIIPVYNVECYLGECLDSVCNQSLQDIEIICINDGSTDRSLQILQNYAKQDSRVFIINQKNHGLSYSRNVGFNHARGKYIYFLDSDDYIATDCLERLCEAMDSENLEILLFNASVFGDEGVEEKRLINEENYFKRVQNYPAKCSGEELFALFKHNKEYITPVSTQIYARDFLCRNSLLFYDGIIHEDELYTFQCLLLAEKAGCLNKQLYFRRVRNSSIMDLKQSEKMIFSVFSCFICVKEMVRFCLEKDFQEKNRGTVFLNIERMASICRNRYGTLDIEDRVKVLDMAGKDKFFLDFFVLTQFNNNENIKRLKKEIEDAKKELGKNKEDIRILELTVKKNKEEIKELRLTLKQKDKQNVENLKQLTKQQKTNIKLGRELENIKNGWSFKIGRIITFIPRGVRDILRH